MQKKLGSILLIAGTCIGSGMIALPIVLAKLGILYSFFLMFATWALMYYTSLVNLELNLQAGQGLSLGALGRKFSGIFAESIGTASLKILSYSLLAAYLYGGTSITQKLLPVEVRFSSLASFYAAGAAVLLLFPVKITDYVNRILFSGLVVIIVFLIAGLVSIVTWHNLPLFPPTLLDFLAWQALIPVVFTSFGFQVIFHTVTNYCNKDPKILKKAFFWGSLIPALVYFIWTGSVLSVIHHENPLFYTQMTMGKSEVGDLIKELSRIAKWEMIHVLVGLISLLAILTSVLGVGIGLCESLETILHGFLPSSFLRRCTASVATVLPAYIVTLFVPNAFIAVLGFAGMILVIIAVLLPVYLLYQAKIRKFYYAEANKRLWLYLCVISGIGIILCELVTMIKS